MPEMNLMQGAQTPQWTQCISFKKCACVCVFYLLLSSPSRANKALRRTDGHLVIFYFLSGGWHMLCIPDKYALVNSAFRWTVGAGRMLNLRTSNNVEEDTEINRGKRGDLMGTGSGCCMLSRLSLSGRPWIIYQVIKSCLNLMCCGALTKCELENKSERPDVQTYTNSYCWWSKHLKKKHLSVLTRLE